MTFTELGTKKIVKQGSSLGVTISPFALAFLKAQRGDELNVSLDDDNKKIMLEKKEVSNE